MHTLKELADLGEYIRYKKPRVLLIDENEILVRHWTEVCREIVKWLQNKRCLNITHCPVPDCHDGGKYFINSDGEHARPYRKAPMERVGSLYINVTYNTDDKIRNIRKLLRDIGLADSGIKIGLR
ncbi:MAG: hypothetical protein ACLQVJ_13135 [Syntrophobacteraceae bacterium]